MKENDRQRIKHMHYKLPVSKPRYARYLVAILIWLSVSEAGANHTCQRVFAKAASANNQKTDQSGFSFESYIKRTDIEGDYRVSDSWLKFVKAISMEDTSIFKTLVPKHLLELQAGTRGGELSTPNRPNRRLKEGFLVGEDEFFVPEFFHLSSVEGARQILNSQFLKISKGAHNEAAICLGDAGFRMFPSRKDIRVRNFQVTLMQVELNMEAKIIDLTESFGGQPGEYSHLKAYRWYTDIFLENLHKGMYAKTLPQITKLVSQFKHSNEWMSLRSKEAFGLLLGADLILTSEKYGQIFADEYWVINPTIVKSIKYHYGVEP